MNHRFRRLLLAGLVLAAATVSSAQSGARNRSAAPDRAAPPADPAAEMVASIRAITFGNRGVIHAAIESRLQAVDGAIVELRDRAAGGGSETRSRFAKAEQELRAREKDLRNTLRASAKTKNEEAWGAIRETLARDYEAFARALSQAARIAESAAKKQS